MKLTAVLNYAEIDHTVVTVIGARVASLAANALTLFMIATRLSPELQGYFYTFTSLLALQQFLELGFAVVITQFASHEWSQLRLTANGEITGDHRALSRLASLFRLVVRWYAIGGFLFVFMVGTAGYVFLSRRDDAVNWFLPWVVLVPLAAVQFWVQPTLSFLEGCGQVAGVARLRLVQGLASNAGMWIALTLGAGLWIAPASAAAGLVASFAVLTNRYGVFFRSIRTAARSSRIDWLREVWPMQWRVALSGVVNYFAFSLFTPVMFNYHGPVAAGQIGMTLTLVGTLTSLASLWVQARVPAFGMLIAKRDYEALDRTFWRTGLGSLALMAFGAVVLSATMYLLPRYSSALSGRLLPAVPGTVFIFAALLAHVVYCIFAYLRAHKKEPLMGLSVVSGALLGLTVWSLGRAFGPLGAALAQLGVVGLFTLPVALWLGLRYREDWHRPVNSNG